MLRGKILAELKKKFPGLSNEFLGLLAISLEKKVTEESQIEGAITELDNSPIPVTELAAHLQKEGDRRVTDAEKKFRAGKTGTEQRTDNADAGKDNLDPENPLTKTVQELQKMVTQLVQNQSKQSIGEKIQARLKDKKIPAQFAKGRTVEKEEDLDNLITEIEADYTEMKQGLINEGVLSMPSPVAGVAGLKTDNVDADIKNWSLKNQPVAAK